MPPQAPLRQLDLVLQPDARLDIIVFNIQQIHGRAVENIREGLWNCFAGSDSKQVRVIGSVQILSKYSMKWKTSAPYGGRYSFEIDGACCQDKFPFTRENCWEALLRLPDGCFVYISCRGKTDFIKKHMGEMSADRPSFTPNAYWTC